MNNQIPYGFMPDPFMNNNRMLEERIDRLEKQVKRLEKKVAMLENNNYPMPNFNSMSNNY